MKNMQDEEGEMRMQGSDPQNMITWEQEVEREMWLERDQSHLLGQGDGGFISYDDFPPFPDFPCISSSSSSSCSSAPTDLVSATKPPINYSSTCSSSSTTSTSKSSSSSSASSWARAKSNLGGRDHQVDTNQSNYQEGTELQGLHQFDGMDSDCMHVMEELGDMDLDDIWDPSCIFPYEEDHQGLILGGGEEDQGNHHFLMGGDEGVVHGDDDQGVPSEDLAMVFFEWLKSNKESISADDLRSIKLKRSTIECAAKKLGGGKEGMKQLLKLILEWVQNHQLQNKKNTADGVFLDCTTIATTPDPAVAATVANPTPLAPLDSPQPQPQPPTQFQNANPHTPLPPDSMANLYNFMPQMPQWSPFPQPVMGGYNMGDGGGVGGGYPQPDYQTWVPPPPPTPQTHFTMPGHHQYMNAYQNRPVHIPLAPAPPPTFNQYPCQVYPNHAEIRLMRFGASATKEARKKRMARQKRLFLHGRNHNSNQHQIATEQQAQLVNDTDCTNTDQGNWVFRYSTPNVAASPMLTSETPPAPQLPPPPPPPTKMQQRQTTSEKRQASKTTSGNEKNLKFLLQKVLKQSDVGNLGRIVLPKEAETYLPQLEARDGISITMEDIGTSRVWNMRYRFWPNNKSRMYLLENTVPGPKVSYKWVSISRDFVRSNGLQEGDFIVIYSDIKCGKYLIRGVKVRQSGSKTEARKQGKMQRYLQAKNTAGIGGSCMREARVMI